MEAERLQVVVQQQQHELRCQKKDLETTRQTRWQWQGRAETMLEENERLRRQMDEMLPEMQFVEVGSWQQSREMMQWSRRVNPGFVAVGVDVQWRAFERRDCGAGANEAFVQALVDRICRQVKDQVHAQFMLLG